MPAGRRPANSTNMRSRSGSRAINVNMLSAVEAVQLVLPGMKAAGFGRIVNITSFVVKEPYPNMALANSIRVGLTGAMSTLAREVAAHGITVNNILPGLMDTGALQRVINARVKKQHERGTVRQTWRHRSPTGRLGAADDFGPLCAFLCSRRAPISPRRISRSMAAWCAGGKRFARMVGNSERKQYWSPAMTI